MNYPAQRQPPLPPMMTVADFLDWPGDGFGTRFELVDGVLRAMAPASDTHGTIQGNLTLLIGLHLRSVRSPCRVVSNPGIQPRVRAEWNFRIPDLGVTCQPNRPGEVMTPEPIVLIEVLSPGNANETYENVRAYATLPTLREIAVVHSTRMRVELLARDAAGNWPADPVVVDGPSVTLASIGAELPFAEIYLGTHLAAST
jgi:Uma2 family endonuclease